jgi:hypothetical protein
MRRLLPCAALALASLTAAAAPEPPEGWTIPESTLSADGRFGVLVPEEKAYRAGGRNQLVEVATGRVLAVINAAPGMEQMNHGGVDPTRWSSDSSLALWRVDGKWFPRALVLLRLQGDAVEWQLDLLKTAQKEILTRVREASPKKYAAAREENKGNGRAYPDGFTVDVQTEGEQEATPPQLPLRVSVTLTSNPKAIESYPPAAQLDATLEAEVTADGKFHVRSFALAP